MAAYFFDSSALAKCYINEPGTNWIRGITAPHSQNDLHVLEIAELEVVSAIARRRKGSSLTSAGATSAIVQLRHDLRHAFILLKISTSLLSEATALADHHGLRAYDALHLAAAVDLNEVRRSMASTAVTVVSADLELNAAALANSLAVEDPNAHP